MRHSIAQNRASSANGRLRRRIFIEIFVRSRLAETVIKLVILIVARAFTPWRCRAFCPGVIGDADWPGVIPFVEIGFIHFPAAKDADMTRVRCPNRRRHHARRIVHNRVRHRMHDGTHEQKWLERDRDRAAPALPPIARMHHLAQEKENNQRDARRWPYPGSTECAHAHRRSQTRAKSAILAQKNPRIIVDTARAWLSVAAFAL